MKNPLLIQHTLPPFKSIDPKHIPPALKKILTQNRATLKRMLVSRRKPSWENIMTPLEMMAERLQQMWSTVEHLTSVLDSKPLREIYQACLPEISKYLTELGHNTLLYKALQRIPQKNLTPTQRKIIRDSLRDFKLAGITLSKQQKKQFATRQVRHAQLEAKFVENVLDATQSWDFLIGDKKRLSGLPQSMIAQTKQAAQAKKLKGYLLTLEIPLYIAVMTYADDQNLREIMYEAYMTRASDQGPHAGLYDNTNIIHELLTLRQDQAQLLGFKNYAAYSLATKMAKHERTVIRFLNDLLLKVKPMAQKEMRLLKKFTKEKFGCTCLHPWDIAYYSEKLKLKEFQISAEKLRPFFPATQVLKGLFLITEKLFGMRIQENKTVETWHPDVRFFEVYDTHKNLRGGFYIDLYVRENKRSGAWCGDCRTRRKMTPGKIQMPAAYVVCNFMKPSSQQPSLLTHIEVRTLFHEFGHSLQHILTQVDFFEASGMNGVEWDAVELCSQFMENFCWQKPVIDKIAKHYKTGKTLPSSLFKKLIQSQHFQAGLQILRQLEFSLFDLELHRRFNPQKNVQQTQRILDRIHQETTLIKRPDWTRFQHAFLHIFGGGYSAGYYSYSWAEVLSSDVFARFEEEGIFNVQVGHDFLHHILETGGSRDTMISFVKFRGRKPRIDALLRHRGIK